MKKKFYTACLWLTGFAGIAQQNTVNRPVSPFTSLELNGTAKVEIVSYDSLFCELSGDVADFENVQFTQQDDKLVISTSGSIKGKLQIKLGCKGLQQIKTGGVSSLESNVIYKTEKLRVESDDASKIKLMAEAKYIDLDSDGASNIRIKGSCDSLTIKADGVSNIKAYYLQSKTATVSSDGTSKVYVTATQKLKAMADGVSHIYYGGKPSDTKLSVDGVAKISPYAEGDSEDKKDFNINIGTRGGFKHWTGVGLHMNGYTTSDFNTSLPADQSYMDLNFGKSIGWDLNLLQHNFHLWKNYINLATGIGFQFNTYHFKNAVTLNPDSSFVTGYITPDVNYSKNVLKTSYVNVPLILDFNTSKNPRRSFHVSFGAMGGLKLASKTKQFYENSGYEIEVYRKDDYNLNPFKVQAIAQIGYSWFNLYGTYNLTPLFCF